MRTIWNAIVVATCAALAGSACSSGRAGPSQASITTACMHICMCETGMSDTTCLSRCSMGSGTSSFSSFSSSLSTSFSLSAADQACVDCINAASCADLTSGLACNTECQ